MGLWFQSFKSPAWQAWWQEQELSARREEDRNRVRLYACEAGLHPAHISSDSATSEAPSVQISEPLWGHFSFKLLYMSVLPDCCVSQPEKRALPEPMTVR